MNLLLATIDSLRLDYVSRTNSSIQTPRFDGCTQRFHFSDRCFSVSSATRPVHTSLFTGLYPFEHGILSQSDSRLRSGIPRLFELLRKRSYQIGAFSEAAEIFTGLDLGQDFHQLAPSAAAGGDQLRSWLASGQSKPGSCRGRALFVHYWGTHTPYGAADNKAMGETARLLAQGQTEIIHERYSRAVEETFELKLAPLVEKLDPQTWCMLIVSDHGESWRVGEELYHGATLRNSVLRIPLYLHIPGGVSTTISAPIISIIDLFATMAALFDLPVHASGFGVDVRRDDPRSRPLLAQIHPTAGSDLPDEYEAGGGDNLLLGSHSPGRQWSLFDHVQKFTCDDDLNLNRLEGTFSEEPLTCGWDQTTAQQSFNSMKAASSVAHYPLTAAQDDDDLLFERLRALGYVN